MCDVVYKDVDGNFFYTDKYAMEYIELPRVYVILGHFISKYIVDVVLTKEEAETYVKDARVDNVFLIYESWCVTRYKKTQKLPISDPYVIDKKTYESLWDKIKQKIFGGKDEVK